MRFRCLVSCVFVGLIGVSSCLPEPPANNNKGWGQQQQQPQQQSKGWGQQQQQPQQAQGGWGQPQQQEAQTGGWGQPQMQTQGWGQPQMQAMQAQGWGPPPQESQSGGWGQSDGGHESGGHKGKGVNWGFNFALGHQGDDNKGGGGKGGGGGGGWSSMPETNIKKPNIGEIFRTIIGIPREIKNFIKESGLWILFLPLIVIIPLIYVAYSAGRFFGGISGHGWGWDKRSASKMNDEWQALMGFLKDPKVHKAAKGFMDEFVVKRILTSVEDPVVIKKSVVVKKSS